MSGPYPNAESQKLNRISGFQSNQYAVKVGDLQWVRIPPGQSVARPEATRAAKWGKSHLPIRIVARPVKRPFDDLRGDLIVPAPSASTCPRSPYVFDASWAHQILIPLIRQRRRRGFRERQADEFGVATGVDTRAGVGGMGPGFADDVGAGLLGVT